ncbi:MAG: SRPBCC domain-containing protein, partial [Phycisphaerae bacterium]
WGLDKTHVHTRTYVYTNGEERCMAEGVYAWDPERHELFVTAFGHLGKMVVARGGLKDQTLMLEFASKGVDYYQEIEYVDADSYEWRLYRKTEEGNKLATESTFKRDWTYVPAAPRPAGSQEKGRASAGGKTWVDGDVTVTATTEPERRQDFAVIIPAPVGEVWRAMTTAEGMKECYPSEPELELAIGGKWEVHPGAAQRVLSYVPHEMLSVTGSAPPQFPTVREGGTWAVIRFQAIGDKRTRLRLSILGWQSGGEWDRAFEYFLKNNAIWLKMIRERFERGPIQERNRPKATATAGN